MFFLFKQKTVYEMRISDWSADVCSSDLAHVVCQVDLGRSAGADGSEEPVPPAQDTTDLVSHAGDHHGSEGIACPVRPGAPHPAAMADVGGPPDTLVRSEEHTSELQSLMRTSYAVFCLKKKQNNSHIQYKP